jgi:ComF family protein
MKSFLDFVAYLKEEALDLFYPKSCVGCGASQTWLCENCQKKIVFVKSATCPFCGRLTEKGEFCKKCRPKTFLNGVVAAAYLEEGPLKEAIHAFKYDFVQDLVPLLGKIMVQGVRGRLPHPAPLLIPVPLHKKRRIWRGFNQAEILAAVLSREFNLPLLSQNLLRIRHTRPQIELSGLQRRQNVKDAFFYQGPSLRGEVVVLVDDVVTTCSTLNECAKALRQAGAKQVWGLVLAKE